MKPVTSLELLFAFIMLIAAIAVATACLHYFPNSGGNALALL